MRPLAIALVILISLLGQQTSHASELAVRDKIIAKCTGLLSAENFSELENLLEQYRHNQERTPSGAWKLAVCYLGIQDHYTNPAAKHDAALWDRRYAKVAKWREQMPESASARLVEAIFMIEQSRQIRRSKRASKDPLATQRLAVRTMKQAQSHLGEARNIAAHDPHWYVLMGQTGIYTGQLRNDFFLMMEEAYDRHPRYLELYQITIRFLDANWPGNYALYEALANSAVARTEATEGLALYARIFWRAYSNPSVMSHIVHPVHWPKMKDAMDDVLKKYPDQWNIQSFAFYACMARDRKKASELFALISGPPIQEAWQLPNRHNTQHYGQCRSFVDKAA